MFFLRPITLFDLKKAHLIIRVDTMYLQQGHHTILEQNDHELVVDVIKVNDQLKKVYNSPDGQLRQVDGRVYVL